MKTVLILLLFFPLILCSQSVNGVWKTIDDKDGLEKSHIELSIDDGVLTGKIIKLLEAAEGNTCIPCKGERKDKPLVGMEILWDLKQKGDTWSGGKIFDPKSGKEYKCKLSLADNPDELNVRGYIGFSLVGRTQTWYRVKKSTQ